MTDLTSGILISELVKASLEGDTTLADCLSRFLTMEAENKLVNHSIYSDYAPRSFMFTRYYNGDVSTVGGIIYHGPHDNGGDGSAPTFSVSLTPHKGWSVHT